MKRLSISELLSFLFGPGQSKTQINQPLDNPAELYNTFDKSNHLQPLLDKNQFENSHAWDFGWNILEPINIATNQENSEIELSKKISPGQKALYFFWYLDAEVTNGGFIQFYWNNNRRYLPPIIDGLKLIGDISMLILLDKADKEYLKHKNLFILQRQKDDWQPLYENLKNFDKFDNKYYAEHDRTMELIEKYARQYPEEFVKFK